MSMILCNNGCMPCCDFCIHCEHEHYEYNGEITNGAPIGCNLYNDKEHNELAEWASFCDDFHCSLAEE